MDTDYKYILNKIFKGSVLKYDLGHEIINFIKLDDNNRYIYVNPRGEKNKESDKHTKYVYHIMNTKYQDEAYYELVAVSKVDKTNTIIDDNVKFNTYPITKIFEYKNYNKKTYPYTFKSSNFYIPTKRVLFKTGLEKPSIEDNNDIVIVKLICNPKRPRAYSKTLDSAILDIITNKYLKETDETINLDNYKDELPLAIISDRTKLEDSLSNEIAYFLTRDKELNTLFINNILNIKTNEEFEILREKENIDLLLIGNKDVVVIENKIDSHIHGDQLTNYINYINKTYKDKTNKHFYILMPRENNISKEELNNNNGSNYKIIYYDEIYNLFKDHEYKPHNKPDNYKTFIFNEFIYTLKYVSMSNSKKEEEVAYIRLKQRLSELEYLNETKR